PRKQRTAIQFTADELTAAIVERAQTFRVRGMRLKVAIPSDLVRLKLAAAAEPAWRPSKCLSDITDAQRLMEAHPEIEREVPDALERLEALLERSRWEIYWRKYSPQRPRLQQESGGSRRERSRVTSVRSWRPRPKR